MKVNRSSIKKLKTVGQIIGILLLIQLLSGIVGLGLNEISDNVLDFTAKLILINSSFVLIVATFIIYLIKTWKVGFCFKYKPFTLVTFVVIILISLCTYFIENIFFIPHFIEKIMNKALVFDVFKIRKPLGANSLYFTELILSVIFAPVIEEILYRKLIFEKLKTVFKSGVSIVITSVLFAAMHLSVNGFLQFLFVGIVLTYTYHLTHNLLLNIIFHSLLNIMFYLFERSEIAFSHRAILMCVCFYILCGVTLYHSLKYLKIQKTK